MQKDSPILFVEINESNYIFIAGYCNENGHLKIMENNMERMGRMRNNKKTMERMSNNMESDGKMEVRWAWDMKDVQMMAMVCSVLDSLCVATKVLCSIYLLRLNN